MLTDIIDIRRSLRLELIVVLLILFEVLVAISKPAERYLIAASP